MGVVIPKRRAASTARLAPLAMGLTTGIVMSRPRGRANDDERE